jgi:hypothetical protein
MEFVFKRKMRISDLFPVESLLILLKILKTIENRIAIMILSTKTADKTISWLIDCVQYGAILQNTW